MKKLFLVIPLFLLFAKAGYSSGPVAGVTLGTPGLININTGYYGETFGIGLSISFLHLLEAWADGGTEETTVDIEENSGFYYALFQLNLDWKLIDSGDFIFALSAAGGTICLTDNNTADNDITVFYAGPCVHIIWYGFFAELGAAYGRDFSAKYEENKTGLIPLVQIGYLYKF